MMDVAKAWVAGVASEASEVRATAEERGVELRIEEGADAALVETPKPYVYDGNRKLEVISLREALARRGFPIESLAVSEYIAKQADSILVGFSPDSKVQFRNGEGWHHCGGLVLFSFAPVRPHRGNSGSHYFVNNGYGIRIAQVPNQFQGTDVRLELVQFA